MNEAIGAIKKRRSVRAYTSDPVPREMIEAIIDAGNWAPTGCNLQRWRFVVIVGGEFRERLVRAASPTFRRVIGGWMGSQNEFLREYFVEFGPRCRGWPRQPYEETMAQLRDQPDSVYWAAPAIIFVIGTAHDECAMVCQNMMLAATSLGLGSCIVGFGAQVTDDPEIVEALDLKDSEKIYGPVVIGYPHIYPEPPQKKAPVVKWI